MKCSCKTRGFGDSYSARGRYRFTTQQELRTQFWVVHPELSRRRIRDYSGHGKMYTTDTRTAFVDYLDALVRDGEISEALASRATLS